MSGGVLLLGDDLPYMTALSAGLRSISGSLVISASPHAVRRALKADLGQPEAAIVFLDGSENIADVRLLMSANPATTFLFLSRASPPRSAMAHAVHDCGGAILARSEEPLVITATLIALMAQGSEAANQS